MRGGKGWVVGREGEKGGEWIVGGMERRDGRGGSSATGETGERRGYEWEERGGGEGIGA